MGKLDDLRARIDAIDEAILGLLEQRATVAEQAAAAKREAGAARITIPNANAPSSIAWPKGGRQIPLKRSAPSFARS